MHVAALADPGPAQAHLLSVAGAHILLDAGLDLEAGGWLVPEGLRRERAASDGDSSSPHLLLPPAPAFKAALFEAHPAMSAVRAILATSPAGLLGLPYALEACGQGGGPPPLVLAPDWAVDAAVAWVADLGAASTSAAASSCSASARTGPWTDADLPPATVRALPTATVAALFGPSAVAALAAEPPSTPPSAPLPPPVAAARAAWRAGPYPTAAALAALANVRRVSYGEPVPLLPGGRLVATARASGATPGGAAWVLEAPARRGIKKIVYLASSAPPPPAFSSASDPANAVDALTAAVGGAVAVAAPLEVEALRKADVLIFAPPAVPSAASRPAGGPATLAAAAAAADAAAAGSCALLPIHPDGSAYALMEATAAALRARGLGHVPLVVAGPGAERSLSAGVAGGEWFAPPRRALLFDGRPPIGAGDLRAKGQLVVCAGLAELVAGNGGGRPGNPHAPGGAARWRSPAVVFAPLASLGGDGSSDGGPGATAAALARAWAADPASALILTHPAAHEGSGGASVAPFHPARLVDASPAAAPAPAEAATLIAALAPRTAVITPALWEDALAAAVAAGAAPAPGCGQPEARLVPFSSGVCVGDEDEEDGGGPWPADVDPSLIGDPHAVVIASVGARDGRLALAPPALPAAAAGAPGGSALMRAALAPGRAAGDVGSQVQPTVEGILAALRARGVRGVLAIAREPAEVAALASADPAAGAALAALSASSSSSITALISLPGAGAAIVLSPGATHVHAASGVIRQALVAAVQAELTAVAAG